MPNRRPFAATDAYRFFGAIAAGWCLAAIAAPSQLWAADTRARFRIKDLPAIALEIPALVALPPLNIAALCPLIAANNAAAQAGAGKAALALHETADDGVKPFIKAAELCAKSAAPPSYEAYEELADFLVTHAARTPDVDVRQLLLKDELLALRGALDAEPDGETARELLDRLAESAQTLAEKYGAPDYYRIEAEAAGARATLCAAAFEKQCRIDAQNSEGIALEALARWKSDSGIYKLAIAAYRRSLVGVSPKSRWEDYVSAHDRIGNALAYFSEWQSGETKAAMLKEALAEYEIAARHADQHKDTYQWASLHTNICAALNPLADYAKDRVMMQRARAECESGLSYWSHSGDEDNAAVAQATLGDIHKTLAQWDKDVAAAQTAVRYYRLAAVARTPALQNAFMKTALCDALIVLGELTGSHDSVAAQAHFGEAEALLDEAEPDLRKAGAQQYIASLEKARTVLRLARQLAENSEAQKALKAKP